jgi:hypothetical protein
MENNRAMPNRAKGGLARAAALSPEERAESARRAAAARWEATIPQAKFGSPDRPLRIGESEIHCYVLEDGRRVLSQADFLEAIGRHRKANVRREGGEEQLPAILQGKAINPFISHDIIEKSRPIRFRMPSGGHASGYTAELLPAVCEVYLKAKDARVLPANQQHVARKAEILIRGLAHVGIIALVDEATGYQSVREKEALQSVLDAFLRKELAAWAKRFPDEFYEQIFRLRNWQWRGRKTNPPQVVASYTKDFVYSRLAPRIIEELERKNPSDSGKRKSKHHQWLTDDVGHPALAQHLHAVITLMRISTTWDQFKSFLDQAHPKRGDTMMLPLMIEPSYQKKPNEPLPLFERSHDASQES